MKNLNWSNNVFSAWPNYGHLINIFKEFTERIYCLINFLIWEKLIILQFRGNHLLEYYVVREDYLLISKWSDFSRSFFFSTPKNPVSLNVKHR